MTHHELAILIAEPPESMNRHARRVQDDDAGAIGKGLWLLAAIDHERVGSTTLDVDPVRTVRATVRITEEEVEAIRVAMASDDRHLPQWTLAILDEQDEVVATVVKTLYVRRKREG